VVTGASKGVASCWGAGVASGARRCIQLAVGCERQSGVLHEILDCCNVRVEQGPVAKSSVSDGRSGTAVVGAGKCRRVVGDVSKALPRHKSKSIDVRYQELWPLDILVNNSGVYEFVRRLKRSSEDRSQDVQHQRCLGLLLT